MTEITVWMCPECGYWRKERTTGVHQTNNPENRRGKMLVHELQPVTFIPGSAATEACPDHAAMRDLAGLVLERTSQDCGPADCVPWTGWCVDLARDVLALLDEAGA